MTADQLTEKMIDLRRRYKVNAEEADQKIARLKVLAEEMQSLGCGTQGNRRIEDIRFELNSSTLNEAVDVVREFLGLPSGVRF